MSTDCPSDDQLLAYHLGTLSEGEVDVVTDHLETCALCEGVLGRLDAAGRHYSRSQWRIVGSTPG